MTENLAQAHLEQLIRCGFPQTFGGFTNAVQKHADIFRIDNRQVLNREFCQMGAWLLRENSQVPPEKQFSNEVANLMAVQHENIVKLVGFCHESHTKVVEHNKKYIIVDVAETFLCYEYLPRESLDKYIFGTYCDTCCVIHVIRNPHCSVIHVIRHKFNVLQSSQSLHFIGTHGSTLLKGSAAVYISYTREWIELLFIWI
jgi:hypothetical protein